MIFHTTDSYELLGLHPLTPPSDVIFYMEMHHKTKDFTSPKKHNIVFEKRDQIKLKYKGVINVQNSRFI